MNIYTFPISALCPNYGGNVKDSYVCILESPKVIECETILEVAGNFQEQQSGKLRFQEEIADELKRVFGCRVTLTGFHLGVKVECVRE